MIQKILLTGGPGGGKTTLIERLKKTLKEKGFCPLCFPEVPTLLFEGGVELEMIQKPECLASFEEEVAGIQLRLELAGESLARYLYQNQAVLLFDRGIPDIAAYMDQGDYEILLRSNRLTKKRALELYTLVIHMVSAADGAPEHYSNATNARRSESLNFARGVEKRTLAAYEHHPNRIVVPNVIDGQQITFTEKLQFAEQVVVEFLARQQSEERRA
jgi:predicted ATPase